MYSCRGFILIINRGIILVMIDNRRNNHNNTLNCLNKQSNKYNRNKTSPITSSTKITPTNNSDKN